MAGHELDSQLSLDRLPEFLSERLRGARGTDLSASLLHEMSRTEDLQGSLLELHVQGGRLYGQAMSALQRVLGNAGVERLHQELSALAEGNANADGGAQDVQLKQGAGARPSNAELLDAAADGASTSGDAVPFAQEMEALLGVDFSSTRAHIGAEAETACEEMGAQAYTYGENVVFREANPSKEIVAHELTHVVQQRQGVQLTGGVGQVGDAYEQQAEQAERGVAPSMEGPQTSATLAVQTKEATPRAQEEAESTVSLETRVAANKAKGYQARVVPLARQVLGLGESSEIDEEFVEALLEWQPGTKTGVLDHATLLAMAPQFVEALDVLDEAKDFYANPFDGTKKDERGHSERKKEQETGAPIGPDQYAKLRENEKDAANREASVSEPDGAEETRPPVIARDHEPFETILRELELRAQEAFVSMGSLEEYVGQPVEVTDLFVQRALIWQIEAKLGLVLDGQLGTSSLVRMGFAPTGGAYAIWNVNNLERGEEDEALTEQLEGYGGDDRKDVEVVSVEGTEKRLGDLTGDDGITFGMAHLTAHRKLARFLVFIEERWGKQKAGEQFKEEERLTANPLEVHFGPGATASSVNQTLGFDAKDKGKTADNAHLLRLLDTPDPLGEKENSQPGMAESRANP